MSDEAKQRSSSIYVSRRSAGLVRRRSPGDARPTTLDWPTWLNLIERKRKLIQRLKNTPAPPPPRSFYVDATFSAFRLEGIDASEDEVIDALALRPGQRKFRSRSTQRIRNHVAILHSIAASLKKSEPLKTTAVLRWYTSISSGLSTGELGAECMNRLEQTARRVNSPQLRLQPAILEIIRTHRELLSDPLFPSFNGILARLLLRYHLGRCGLLFSIIEEIEAPMTPNLSENDCTYRLMCMIDESYEMML